MFDGIRAAMKVPLARPPGRRGLWSRFAPELCALAVYGFGLAVLLYRAHSFDAAYVLSFSPNEKDVMTGIVAAYCLAALVLVVLPVVQSLAAWHGEHSRETADALVLTPSDHATLACGRYWHIVWPWLRFLLWVVPIYLGLAFHPLVGEVSATHSDESLLVGGAIVGASKGLLGTVLIGERYGSDGLSAVGLLLVASRWLCDAKSVLALVAFGCLISARIKSTAGLLSAYVLLPLAAATAFSFHDWVLLSLALISRFPGAHINISDEVAGAVYVPTAALVLAAEIVLAVWAYRSLARNFDACMTGEKPDRIGAHRRRPA